MAIARPPIPNLLSLPHTLRPLLLRSLANTSFLRTSSTSSTSPTTSIDPNEVSHFNSLAASWWDPSGPSRLLHLMNPLRHTFISSCLASQPDAHDAQRKLHYLDVGCGGGIFAESAARLRNAVSVTGVDPSSEVLAVAKEHARRDPRLAPAASEGAKLRYLNIGIEELAAQTREQERDGTHTQIHQQTRPQPQKGYDIVTLFEVLEHVSDPSAFLAQVGQHVRPGGWLILSTIARTWTSWLTTKLMAEDVLRIVPRGTHEWSKYVNEAEVRSWFEGQKDWSSPRAMGVVYVPGIGWREVRGGEEWGNYFFGVRKRPLE